MKPLLFFCFATCWTTIAFAQNIGIGTTTPAASALLDISSTTRGLLAPRMTTLQRQAIVSPAHGLLVYDTDTNSFWYYNSLQWTSLTAGNPSDWSSNSNGTHLSNLNGRVGIGTSNPHAPLTVHYSGFTPGLVIKSTKAGAWAGIDIDGDNNDAAIIFKRNGNGTWNIRNHGTTDDFQIFELNGGGPRFIIKNTTGNTGIGLNNPVNVLDVNGRIRIRHNGVSAGIWTSNSTNGTTNSDGAFWGMLNDNTAGIFIGNAWRFQFFNNGNVTIGGTLTQHSDSRLKRDIHTLQNASQKIAAVSGYNYYWIAPDRDPELQTGLLAEEVEKVMPELVKTDEAGMKSVNYIGLIPYMLESVKTQQLIIMEQQEQIAKMKMLIEKYINR